MRRIIIGQFVFWSLALAWFGFEDSDPFYYILAVGAAACALRLQLPSVVSPQTEAENGRD